VGRKNEKYKNRQNQLENSNHLELLNGVEVGGRKNRCEITHRGTKENIRKKPMSKYGKGRQPRTGRESPKTIDGVRNLTHKRLHVVLGRGGKRKQRFPAGQRVLAGRKNQP